MIPPVRKYKSLEQLVKAAALAICVSSLLCTNVFAAKDGPTLRPIPDATLKKVVPVAAAKTVAVTKTPDTHAEAKKPTIVEAKAKPKPDPKAEAKSKTEAKNKAKAERKEAKKVLRAALRSSMVPPPPPDTPTMLSDPAMMAMGSGLYGMQVEYMSKDALKDRVKEISIQYKDASVQLVNKKSSQSELQERAKTFEQLYAEGVVSRRELENAQKDASGSDADIARLESNCRDLKSLLDRINKRLATVTPKPFKSSKVTVQKKKITRGKAAK